jgi:hypothetical protein
MNTNLQIKPELQNKNSGIYKKYSDAYADFLDKREWNLWATMTTPQELTLPGARRAIQKLHQQLYKNGYPSEIFYVAEPFDTKEGFHLHSLIRFANLEQSENNAGAFNELISTWKVVSGFKNSRVHAERYKNFHDGGGANFYVGKYMQKSKCDYDFLAVNNVFDKNLQFDSRTLDRSEIVKEFKNRKDKAAWLNDMREKSKVLKQQIKSGTFEPTDVAPYKQEHSFKQLDYKFLNARFDDEQFKDYPKADKFYWKNQKAFNENQYQKRTVIKKRDYKIKEVEPIDALGAFFTMLENKNVNKPQKQTQIALKQKSLVHRQKHYTQAVLLN